MLKCGDTYFFMWSMGNWGDGSYCVKAAASKSPEGPFSEPFTVVERDGVVEMCIRDRRGTLRSESTVPQEGCRPS